ncbi:MAG: hypothetical protein ACYTGW_02930 [Planctomycetota bacterium]
METVDSNRVALSARLGFLIGPFFLILAGWFLWGPELADIPDARSQKVDQAELHIGPHREVVGDPPLLHINEFERTCMDCHRIFLSKDPGGKPLKQHTHIRLRHGVIEHCYDCHAREERDRLVLRDGMTVPFTEVVTLCGQCHTGILRDWKLGLHGRLNGYWDLGKGQRRRLLCTECHDPHRPAHPLMALERLKPLPPPNTLRMGTPTLHDPEEHHDDDDPLRRVRIRSGAKEQPK